MLLSCVLPGDVLENILTRLPVKSLLRFKAVSKSWYAFLTTPNFIQRHLLHSPERLFTICYNPSDHNKNLMVLGINHFTLGNLDHGVSAPPPPLPFEKTPPGNITIEDSCNGLVLLSIPGQPSVTLWNPATRKYRSIDLPFPKRNGEFYAAAALCYIPSSNYVKIMAITRVHDEHHHGGVKENTTAYRVWVYILSVNSWRMLDISFPNLLQQSRPVTFVQGCVHWIARKEFGWDSILAFDFKKEALRLLPIPDACGYLMRLLVIRGSLSVLAFDGVANFEVWVMTDYGVEGSWRKQFVLDSFSFPPRTLPVGYWRDGEILFKCIERNSKNFLTCNLFTKEIQYFLDSKSTWTGVANYVESLASIDDDGGVLEMEV